MAESIALANAKLDAGEVTAAVVDLEALDQAHPGTPAVIEALAFAYAADQRPQSAGEAFLRRARLDFEGAPYFLYAGSALAQAGHRAAASAAYREYLTAFPEDGGAWATLGRLLDDSNDPAAAVEAYLRAWEARPDPVVAGQLGALFLRLRNAPQAETWYQRALEGGEEQAAPAMVGLLEAALLARRPADAERWLLRLDAEHPLFLDQSASAARRDEITTWRKRQIEAEQAIARQREELRQREEEEAAARRAAELEAARLAAEEAARAAAEAAPPEPEPAGPGAAPRGRTVVDTVALLAELEQVSPDTAFDLLQEALGAQPDNARLWAALAENALTRSDPRWAEAAALEALRLDPAMPAVRRAWARTAPLFLPPDRYLDELAALRRQFPDDADITLMVARTLRDQGGPRPMVAQLLREVIRLAPRHPELAQIQAELAAL